MKRLVDMKVLFGAALACGLLLPATAMAVDPENAGPYYEDDAWYDITEWFDGNDYNPTDERFWVWDNETYDAGRGDYDYDNDRDYGSYGYYEGNDDDDWFYDYYNEDYVWPYGDTTASFAYYDYDGDGIYDAYTAYWDDGTEYYTFNDSSRERNKAQKRRGASQGMDKQDRLESKHQMVSGKIEKIKHTTVRNQKHLIAKVKSDQGKDLCVDLGTKDQIGRSDVSEGKQLSARGPMVHMGDKKLVLAQSVTLNGQTKQINREGRSIRGEIVSTRKAKVRGDQQHQMAIIKNKQGSKRVAVDLGPADELNLQLSEGDRISVTGPTVKVKDRLVVMANSVDHEGRMAQIKRSKGPQMASGRSGQSNK